MSFGPCRGAAVRRPASRRLPGFRQPGPLGCRAIGRRELDGPHHAGHGQAGLGNAAKPAGKPRGEAGRVGRPGRRFATGGRGIHRGERPGEDRLLRRRGVGSPDRPDRRRALSAGIRCDGLGVVADPRQEDSRRRAGDRQFQRHRLPPGRLEDVGEKRSVLPSAARPRPWASSGRRSSA